ncbi:hypothetical protein IWX48DRAFT_651257 [Phyllosticta citricarpa]
MAWRVGVQTLSAIAALQGRARRAPNTPHLFTMIPMPAATIPETSTSGFGASNADASAFAESLATTSSSAAAITTYANIINTDAASSAAMHSTNGAGSTFFGGLDGALATGGSDSIPHQSAIDGPDTTTTTLGTTSSPEPLSIAPITVSVMVPTTEVIKETLTETSAMVTTLLTQQTVVLTSALLSTIISKETATIVSERTTEVTKDGKPTTQILEYITTAVQEHTSVTSKLGTTTAVVEKTIERTVTRSVDHTVISDRVQTQTAVITEHGQTHATTFLSTISAPQSTVSVPANSTAPLPPSPLGHNVGLIAGISVATFFAIGLTFAGLFFFFLHRRNKKISQDAELDFLKWHSAAMNLGPRSLDVVGQGRASEDNTERDSRRASRSISDLYSSTRHSRGPSPSSRLATQVEVPECDVEALIASASSPAKKNGTKTSTRPVSSSSNHSITEAGNQQIVCSPSMEGRVGHAAQVVRGLARDELTRVRQNQAYLSAFSAGQMASIGMLSGLFVVFWLAGLVCGLAGQQSNASHVHMGQQSTAPYVHMAEHSNSNAPGVHPPAALGPWATPLENGFGVASSSSSAASVAPLAHPPLPPSPIHPIHLKSTPTKMATVTFVSEHTLFSTASATYTLIVDQTTTITDEGEAKVTIAPFKTTIVEPYTVTSYPQETVTSVKEHTTTAIIGTTTTTTTSISTVSSAGEYTRTLTLPSTIEVTPSPAPSSSAAASSPASNSDHSHVNTGLIIGICVGVSCIFLALLALFCFSVRRRQSQFAKHHELARVTWHSAAMNLVSRNASKQPGEKANDTSTDTDDALRESPTKPAPGSRTVHDLPSSNTPHRRSVSAQPSYRNSLPTPLGEEREDDNDEHEDDPFLSAEEKTARSPVKGATVPQPMSPSPATPDVEQDEAQKALVRQASIALRSTATFAAVMERQERELKKAREWIDRVEKEREERKQRERRSSLCSELDAE